MATSAPPSTANIAVACAIVGGVTGYMLGQARSLGLFGASTIPELPEKRRKTGAEDLGESSDEEDGDAPSEFPAHGEECKLVLVVRTDLGMSKGKIGAQCGHATLACYKHFLRHAPDSVILRRWERLGQAKVALQVKSEEDMLVLQAQAVSLGLVAHVIHDAGRTQIASGSATVLGIGPAPKGVIDQVTGHLKLL